MLINFLDFDLSFEDGPTRSYKFNSCSQSTRALDFLRAQPELELQENDDVLIGDNPVSTIMSMRDLLAKNVRSKISFKKGLLLSKTFLPAYMYLIF
jgi:hypothetical protein